MLREPRAREGEAGDGALGQDEPIGARPDLERIQGAGDERALYATGLLAGDADVRSPALHPLRAFQVAVVERAPVEAAVDETSPR